MRVKHSPSSRKRTKKLLSKAKGYWGRRSKIKRRAAETVRRAGVYAYRDRRNKKRDFRSLWITRINAAVRERGGTYRTFIGALKKNEVLLSRDLLAKIAAEFPEVFDSIYETVYKK